MSTGEGFFSRWSQRKVQVRQFREDGVLLAGGVQPGETIAAAGVHKIVAGQLMQPRVASRPAAATVGAGG